MRIRINKAGAAALLHSADVGDFLMELSDPVAAAARRDPDPDYASRIRHYLHHSPSRVSARVGAAPVSGMRVEAERGTLARALGNA